MMQGSKSTGQDGPQSNIKASDREPLVQQVQYQLRKSKDESHPCFQIHPPCLTPWRPLSPKRSGGRPRRSIKSTHRALKTQIPTDSVTSQESYQKSTI